MGASNGIQRGYSAPVMAWYLGTAWLQSRVLRNKVPRFMSWNLTFKCNLRCHYCASPTLKVPELKTQEILDGIDAFHRLGMRWVTFSGGEPLLRNDIGTIIDHAKSKGIVVFISTNGTLVPRRMDVIRRVDRITISLDGGPEAHNRVRGEKAWADATTGIRAAQAEGIPVACTCVLSRENLHTVDELLELAEELGVNIMFQPATKWLDSSDKPNDLAPDTDEYRAVIDKLIARKRAGARIANSPAGLKILRRWPDPTPIRSTAGWITCTVEPDGKLIASHITSGGLLEQAREDDAPPWEHFAAMQPLDSTEQPWCGPILELDLVFSLSPSAILNAARIQT
ncbi:MAG: radical SAM protein [Candidatus Hydrogenedens sp.]|nr:radical SAM protein [Candidatus Hydrogenedens sp.]